MECENFSCKKEGTPEPHPCPYQWDINDNKEPYCNCCKECEGECAQDI